MQATCRLSVRWGQSRDVAVAARIRAVTDPCASANQDVTVNFPREEPEEWQASKHLLLLSSQSEGERCNRARDSWIPRIAFTMKDVARMSLDPYQSVQ